MAISKQTSPKAANGKSFWTSGRVVLTLVSAGLISALGLSSCNSNEVTTSNAPANRVTNAAPKNAAPAAPPTVPAAVRDVKLQTLDGGSLKLSDFADKVVVLNLWATWCNPCRQEMPELVKMSNDYKARGLVVLGVATTYNEGRGQDYVKEFVRANNIPYKIIWDDGTLAGPMVEAVSGRSVIPQSFVIARDGRILKHFTGFNPNSTPQLMRQAVEDALTDKGKA